MASRGVDARKAIRAELGEAFGEHLGADFFDLELGRGLRPEAAAESAWTSGYTPFETQAAFHNSGARRKGFSGPVGSGKSLALCREAIRLAHVNAGLPGIIAAPTYRMLHDVTRAAFVEACEAAGVRYRMHLSDNTAVLTDTGSRILFRSLDNIERIRGANLAWFGVDELTYCKPGAWERLEARCRHPRAKQHVGFAVWTPKGFDWVWGSFISDETRKPGHEAFIARPGENTALPADYYAGLKDSYSDRFYQQEVLGEYLNIFSGRAYYAFDRAIHRQPVEFDPALPLCWALDFNVNPMCSVVCQMHQGQIRVLREIVLPDSNSFEAVEEFTRVALEYRDAMPGEKWARPTLQVVLYGDAAGEARSTAGKSDWKIVREALGKVADKIGYTVRKRTANPAVKDRVNAVNARLRNAAGQANIVIDPRCKELIADLEQVAWKTDPHGNVTGQIDKTDSRRTHTSDAFGYLVEYEFPLKTRTAERPEYLGL